MSETGRVLDAKLKALEDRIAKVEEEIVVQRQKSTDLLVELKALQVKVSLYAAGVGAVVGTLVSAGIRMIG